MDSTNYINAPQSSVDNPVNRLTTHVDWTDRQ